MKKLLLCIALIGDSSHLLAAENPTQSRPATEGFFYGFGLGVSDEIYKGYGTRYTPLPLIGYKGEKLSVYGPFVNYEFFTVDALTFYFQMSPRFQSYDQSDSYIFEGMAKRKTSLDAGFGATIDYQSWTFKGFFLSDLLANSNGTEITASISKGFRAGPFLVEPEVATSFLSNDHVDYYYGVETDEINEFTQAYRGVHALNQSIGLTLATPIFFEGMTRVTFKHTWFDTPITDSPLVEESQGTSLQFMFSKFF